MLYFIRGGLLYSGMEIIAVTPALKAEFIATHCAAIREAYTGFLPQTWVDTATNPTEREKAFGKMFHVEHSGGVAPHAFLVRENGEGVGLAGRTIEFAERELRAMGFTRLFVWCLEKNTRARAFYERKPTGGSGDVVPRECSTWNIGA